MAARAEQITGLHAAAFRNINSAEDAEGRAA